IEKEELQSFHQTATELLEDHDSVSVVAAALKMLTKERKDVPVTISSVQPISVKNGRQSDSQRRKGGGGKRFYGNRSKSGRGNDRRSGERRGGERRGGKGNFQKRRN